MAVWKLKGCPRCKGDTFVEQDIDGWVERCLLCGYTRDLTAAAVLASSTPPADRKS